MMTYEDELELVKGSIGSCKHFYWLDNAPGCGVCSPIDDFRLNAFLVCTDIREDVEGCMECGGLYEA